MTKNHKKKKNSYYRSGKFKHDAPLDLACGSLLLSAALLTIFFILKAIF